jgi:hypothetical protein
VCGATVLINFIAPSRTHFDLHYSLLGAWEEVDTGRPGSIEFPRLHGPWDAWDAVGDHYEGLGAGFAAVSPPVSRFDGVIRFHRVDDVAPWPVRPPAGPLRLEAYNGAETILNAELEIPRAPITVELLARGRREQDLRRRLSSSRLDAEALADLRLVDAANTEWAKRVIAERGWPKVSEVGRDGATSFWLIVQHSPDHSFMDDCVELLSDLVEAEEALPNHLALLIDRTRMHRGEPQLYGSQFRSVDGGPLEPWTIEDPERLDERRAAVGLEPFAEYRERMTRTPPGAVSGRP